MSALNMVGSCPRQTLPCVSDHRNVLLPSPHRRPFCERAKRRPAHVVQPVQAARHESYVVVDPTPPTAQEVPSSKPALLGCGSQHTLDLCHRCATTTPASCNPRRQIFAARSTLACVHSYTFLLRFTQMAQQCIRRRLTAPAWFGLGLAVSAAAWGIGKIRRQSTTSSEDGRRDRQRQARVSAAAMPQVATLCRRQHQTLLHWTLRRSWLRCTSRQDCHKMPTDSGRSTSGDWFRQVDWLRIHWAHGAWQMERRTIKPS